MLVHPEVRTLAAFQRNAGVLIKRLKRTGQPTVLTVNGRAALVVQDTVSYQRLLDRYKRAQTILAVQRGLADIEQGRTKPAMRALRKARKKHAAKRAK